MFQLYDYDRVGGSSHNTLLAKSVRSEALVSGLVDQGLAVHRNWDKGLEVPKAYILLILKTLHDFSILQYHHS